MLVSTSLVQAGRQALADCLDELHEDLDRLRDQIQQQLAEMIGSRAGGWITDTLIAAISGSEDALSIRSSCGRTSEFQAGFFDQGEDYLWDGRASSGRDRSPDRRFRSLGNGPDMPLATKVIRLGISIPAIIACLRHGQKNWPGIAVPFITLLGSWLLDRFRRPVLNG